MNFFEMELKRITELYEQHKDKLDDGAISRLAWAITLAAAQLEDEAGVPYNGPEDRRYPTREQEEVDNWDLQQSIPMRDRLDRLSGG